MAIAFFFNVYSVYTGHRRKTCDAVRPATHACLAAGIEWIISMFDDCVLGTV